MICNGQTLFELAPIENMLDRKVQEHGVSHGLTEAGYDIRIKQEILFTPGSRGVNLVRVGNENRPGRFTLASSMERFQMPRCLCGEVKDKSSWARRGLSVFNTVIEPGFKGGLTLELVYHAEENLFIPAGAGIAQVLFYRIHEPAEYTGKYQFQSTDPVPAIFEKS